MTTTRTILETHGIPVPDDLVADLTVVPLSTPQRQGDVGIFPRHPLSPAERRNTVTVGAGGVQVVRGEATGNSHLLHADGTVRFARGDSGTLLGVVEVEPDSVGWLIHTDEHGVNAIAPGTYELRGKRTQREEIERVAD